MNRQLYNAVILSLGIAGSIPSFGQMCDTAVQREKIAPTTSFYDFNGTAANGDVSVFTIFPATQNLGWTGSGSGTVLAMSNATVFNYESANSTVTQSFTRPVTHANLSGTGAVVTVVLSPKNASGGSTPGTTSFDPSIKATYEVLYNSTVYLRIETTDDSSTTATVTPLNNASVTISGTTTNTGSVTTIPMTANGAWPANPAWSTLAVTLPATIANGANLATRFTIGATGFYPGGITRAGDDYAVQSVSFKSCPANITGTVFNDADGAAGGPGGTGTGSPGGTQLYASLVNTGGNVAASVAVAPDGSYSLPVYAAGNFTIRISTVQGTAGQPAPATGLPAGWAAVSEADGTANLSQADTVVNANTNTALTGNNFGINPLPGALSDTLTGQTQGAAATIPGILGNDTDDNTLLPDSISLVAPAGATGITADAQGDTTGFTVPGEGAWSLNADGSVTFTPETGFTANPAPIGYTVTDAAGLKSNAAAIVIEYDHPLPADLLSFRAAAGAGCTVQLSWISGVETNLHHFEIMSGSDGIIFANKGMVAARGSGSSYSYISRPGAAGRHYFRLKMVDLDNRCSYSRIETVEPDCAGAAGLQVYPTIVKDRLTIDGLWPGALVKIYDMKGCMLLTTKADAPRTVLNLSKLGRGSYVMVITVHDGGLMRYKIARE